MVDVTVEIGAKVDKLLEGVETAKHALETIKESTEGITESAKHLAEAIGIAFSVEKLVEFIDRMAELGLHTERTMALLGASAEQVGSLSGVAKLTGTSVDGLVSSFERMTLGIQRSTRDAFSPQTEALRVLGLQARDLIGLPADQYFLKLADAVSKFNPSINLSNALMEVGGRGVLQLLPTLLKGAEGFKELEAQVKATGAEMSGAQAVSYAQLHEKLTLLGMSVQGLGLRLLDYFTPAIKSAADAVRGFVQSIDAARINNALQVVTDKLSLFAIGFVQVFEKISAEIEKFIVRMEYWSQFGVKMFSPDIRDAMMTELDKIDVDTKAKTARITETLQNATKTIKAFFDQQAAISSSAAAHGDAHDDHAAPKRDAAAMNLSAKLDADMQKEALEAQRAGLAEQLTQTKNFLNTQVSLERITAAQRIVAEAGAADKIYEHNVDLLNDELALYPKKSLEAAKINAEIEKLAQKHATEMKLLQGQEILALQQQYMQFLGTVQNAWDSQLQGLLSKTTSWAQAFKNILAQLAIEFIKWAEKKVLVYVAGEAAESAAAASGATTRLGVATAEAAGAAAVKKASVIDSIFQSGAQTFAGVFGFLSPIMGPAAAGPAAASEAVVDAQAGIASFAVGAWELPSDMIAQVHKGEMIVPAGPADALRSGGGGSPTYVTIHAMDARSVAAWAKDNAAALTGAVAGYQRNNPSSRGNF